MFSHFVVDKNTQIKRMDHEGDMAKVELREGLLLHTCAFNIIIVSNTFSIFRKLCEFHFDCHSCKYTYCTSLKKSME